MNVERLLQPPDLRFQVVDQLAAIRECAVDIQHEMRELEGWQPGHFDRSHQIGRYGRYC
jgi:hypothetical protein